MKIVENLSQIQASKMSSPSHKKKERTQTNKPIYLSHLKKKKNLPKK